MSFTLLKKKIEKIPSFVIISISETEFVILYHKEVQEHIEMKGNIFQPYSRIVKSNLPLFILCFESKKETKESDMRKHFKKQGFPFLPLTPARIKEMKGKNLEEIETFIKGNH